MNVLCFCCVSRIKFNLKMKEINKIHLNLRTNICTRDLGEFCNKDLEQIKLNNIINKTSIKVCCKNCSYINIEQMNEVEDNIQSLLDKSLLELKFLFDINSDKAEKCQKDLLSCLERHYPLLYEEVKAIRK